MAREKRNTCSNCSAPFTSENASPSRIKRGCGRCRACQKIHHDLHKEEWTTYYKKYDKEHKERKKTWRKQHRADNPELYRERERKHRLENLEQFVEYERAYNRSIRGRHKTLKSAVRRDAVLETDLLWNLNFYSALIEDAVCHYCLGPLSETGGALDRIENNKHVCYNVVPCCDRCNTIKGDDLSYKEMMLLTPILREILAKRHSLVFAEHADSSSTQTESV